MLFRSDNNFSVQQQKEAIRRIKVELLVYLSNSRKAAEKLIENYKNESDKYVSDIKSLPEKQSFLTEKERFLKANEGLYNFLLQKKVNTEIASEGIISETKTLESPRSVGIVRPDKKKIASTFTSLGLLLGILLVAIRVLFFGRLRTPDELKIGRAHV